MKIKDSSALQSNILDTIKLDKALRLAKNKSREGQLDEAKSIYEDILQKFSKNKKALSELQLLVKGERLVTQDPSSEQFQSIINLYSQGQLQRALSESNKMLERFPNSAALFNIAGAANAGLMQFESAINSYTQALKIKPDYAEAYNNMGAALQSKGDLESAINSYTQALKIKPDYAEAYYNMGISLRDKGDLESAINSYTQALKIKPDYAEASNNMGLAMRDKGDLESAINSYTQALKIKPDYAEASNNMGAALQSKGDLESAINSYTQALKIKPDYAEASNNMGAALQSKGDLESAINSYTQALKIKPDYAEASNNMGLAMRDKGDLESAINSYTQALKIKPDYAEAYNNMGAALQSKGDLESAINSYTQALKIKPDYAEVYYNMGIVLQGVVFDKPNSGLQEVINIILDQKNIVRPVDISKAAISLLKIEPDMQESFKIHLAGEVKESLERLISNLSKAPLLFKLMSTCPLPDLELEAIFMDMRAILLLSINEIKSSPKVLRFQSALALQCFTNEYIYSQSDKETSALVVLEAEVSEALSKGDQPKSQSILCLASYKALNQYKWSNLLNSHANIEEVFMRQIFEPNQENLLKSDIPALHNITNIVSSKVKKQYEENPYPRWVNVGLRLKPAPFFKATKGLELRLFDKTINDVQAPNILIAGCGTGQHSISTASRFENAKVLAVDLSMSSLAYAKRKTEELGVQNIDYMQADILELGKLNRKFNIIESSGVLHHMDEPIAGWRVLTDCLEPGGLMKIGLYSGLARQNILRMRKEINQSAIGSSDAAMKSFRSSVINSSKEQYKKIQSSNDFYSMSELRDLLFHVQEHLFTIPQLKDCLYELGLRFCGFEANRIVRDFKLVNVGQDDLYNLDKWNIYEEANPHCFIGMYQFWCQKPV
ncbi:tetratricopeptide repeat protein [Candidatus Pseudothioglobus sp. Uisw_050_01]|uniref:tetratricopeptide repeat protein n=1 Tax=Candidatus Pseudothioglobus sp. Uisw_050_01 TaxID=3230997 RepID=UPI003A88A7B6